MSTFRIREGTPDDAVVIAEFNCRLARETEHLELDPATVLEGVRNAMAVPGRASYFVADAAGEVVGQLMLTREWSDWRNADMWWLQSVYVKDGWRQQGVFRALLAEAERRARAEGVACLRLYVEAHNQPAQAVYLRRGFADTGYRVMQRDLIVR